VLNYNVGSPWKTSETWFEELFNTFHSILYLYTHHMSEKLAQRAEEVGTAQRYSEVSAAQRCVPHRRDKSVKLAQRSDSSATQRS